MKEYLTKNGKRFIIREPAEIDAENIINYSKILFASTDQLLTTLNEYDITIEKEEAWINNLIQNPNSKLLLAELDNKIVGFLFFIQNTKLKNSHTGEFGVNVHPELQGVGIGRQLIKTLLDWAVSNKAIEKVSLSVFDTNDKAIKLYQSLGFIEEGRSVMAIKQPNGKYADTVQMYILTK